MKPPSLPAPAAAFSDTSCFLPIAEVPWGTARGLAHHDAPVVFRGLAGHWPAVRQWSFGGLAEQLDDVPVQLVAGNREHGATRFVHSTLRQYLRSLEADAGNGSSEPQLYLKEFDLLKAQPRLRAELAHEQLLPKYSLRSLRTWIGPAGASTGLHHDYLDNLAVQIVGTKRWYFVRRGVIERRGLVSSKYDAWAVLSAVSARELAERETATGDFFCVDLNPGDVLYVPVGWWHEVTNLSASLFLGGFFGRPAPVLARWAWVSTRDWLHRRGWFAKGACTCHPAG